MGERDVVNTSSVSLPKDERKEPKEVSGRDNQPNNCVFIPQLGSVVKSLNCPSHGSLLLDPERHKIDL